MVFDVALLGFAADAAMLVRLRGTAARRDAALAAALSRVERLRAAGCPPDAGAGQATPAPGVHEHWRVEPAPGPGLRVRDSVTYAAPPAPAAVVLAATVRC